MRTATLTLLVVALALAGCSSSSAEGSGMSPSRSSNYLSQEEILATNQNNLHEAVSAIRPNWLRTQGQISFQNPEAGQVVVFFNNVLVGNADYLRSLHVRDVVSLQFLNPTEAAARFGLRTNSGPAIVVNTLLGSQ